MKFFTRFLAVMAVALSSITAPALAQEGASASMKQVMPYLDTYYKIPPSDRTLIEIVHRIKSKSLPESQIKAWYEFEGKKVELDLNDRGELWQPPSLETYEANPRIYTNIAMGDIVLATRIRPDIPMTTSMSGDDLRKCLVEADRGIKKVSGWFAFLRPKVKGYHIELKPKSTAEIIYADGKTKKLKVTTMSPVNASLFLDRDDLKGATEVKFSNAPHHMRFED